MLAVDEQIDFEELPEPRMDGGWARYWDQYVRYGRYAREHAGDVNHIIDHGYSHLTKQLPPGRTVITFHDATVLKMSSTGWRTRLSFKYNLSAMRRAAMVVCVSESAKRDLLEIADLKEDRVRVVLCSIDEAFRPAVDRPLVRRRLGLSGDVVLMVGHTHPYMNVERMIRAFGMLVAQQTHDAKLVKLGLPFTPEQMRLIAELEIGDRVQLVGRVPTADLPAYFQAADVLLYAPLLAGFGMPPLEAMASGTPVVCSNSGGIPEIAGDAAIMVDATDEAAMARGLTEVFSNPVKRRRMVDAGFDRARRFEWTHCARQLLEVYRAVGRA